MESLEEYALKQGKSLSFYGKLERDFYFQLAQKVAKETPNCLGVSTIGYGISDGQLGLVFSKCLSVNNATQ